ILLHSKGVPTVNSLASLAVDMSALRARLGTMLDQVVEEAITIQQIPAPTFEEGQRAAYVAERFRALGLEAVETDEVHNVYGRLPGADHRTSHRRPAVLLAAHTDTVFDAKTPL